MITTPDSEGSNMSSNDLETASYSHSDPFGSGIPTAPQSESPTPQTSQASTVELLTPVEGAQLSRPYPEEGQDAWQQPYPGSYGGYQQQQSPAYSQGYSQAWTPPPPSGAPPGPPPQQQGYYSGPYNHYYPAHQYPPGSHSDHYQYNHYNGHPAQQQQQQMVPHPHQQYYNNTSSNGGGSNNCTPSPHAGSDDSGGDAVNEVKHPYYHHPKGMSPYESGYGHPAAPAHHLGSHMALGNSDPYAKSSLGVHSITTSVLKRPRSSLLPASKRSKKSSRHRDPNEPQKPVSAYALFFRDTQAAIKARNPAASFGEVSKHVAAMWDNLDPDSKAAYKKRTETAKKEYLKRLAAYRASLISKGGSGGIGPEMPGSGPFGIGSACRPGSSPGGGSSGFSYPTPGSRGPIKSSHSPSGDDHLGASAMNDKSPRINNNNSSFSPMGSRPDSNLSDSGTLPSSPYHHQPPPHSPNHFSHHSNYQPTGELSGFGAGSGGGGGYVPGAYPPPGPAEGTYGQPQHYHHGPARVNAT